MPYTRVPFHDIRCDWNDLGGRPLRIPEGCAARPPARSPLRTPRPPVPVGAVAMAACALGWLAPSAATACSCTSGLVRTLPDDGAEGVATDASVFLAWSDLDAVQTPLLSEAGTGILVPIDVIGWAEGGMWIQALVPEEPLKAGTAYLLQSNAHHSETDREPIFTTGGGPDDGAPAGAAIDSVAGHYEQELEDGCGSATWIDLALTPGADDQPVLYEIEVDHDETFGAPARVTALSPAAWVGSGICRVNYSGAAPRDRLWVRVRAVDLSGNAGSWSTPEPVDIEGSPPACGCDTGRGPVGWGGVSPARTWAGGAALGVLAALANRRRRRAPGPGHGETWAVPAPVSPSQAPPGSDPSPSN